MPLYYCLLLYRSRHELHELRTLELLAANEKQTMELHDRVYGSHMRGQNRSIARIERKIEKLQGNLDPISVKLTSGYEMRCYYFEVFECARKILLIGVPVRYGLLSSPLISPRRV